MYSKPVSEAQPEVKEVVPKTVKIVDTEEENYQIWYLNYENDQLKKDLEYQAFKKDAEISDLKDTIVMKDKEIENKRQV